MKSVADVEKRCRQMAADWVEQHCYSQGECKLPSKDCLAELLMEAWTEGREDGIRNAPLPQSIQEALNSGDGSYKP